MDDRHTKLLEAIEKHMREDDTISCAPQGITINLNFFGSMDVGTVTAVNLIIKALKSSQAPPQPLHSVTSGIKTV